jgi:hypothetical protein
MAKKKNKGRNNAWNRDIAPWLQNNRGWLSAIGGAIGGAALVRGLTSPGGQRMMNQLATSARTLGPQPKDTSLKAASDSKPDNEKKATAAGVS